MEAAVKIPIKFVVDGEVLEEEDGIRVVTPLGKVRKVRIMGRVVAKFINEDETYASIVVDDETETIRVKFFREMVEVAKRIEPGDLVDVSGRVSVYQEEKSVVCDSCIVLEDMNWELLRKLEIAESLSGGKEEEVLKFIKSRGEVKLKEIVERWKDGKEIVEKLKEMGEIYEPRPGVFRAVE